MDACARVGVEVSATSASACAVVRDLARGAVGELGFGRLVPLFVEYVGKRGGLASPFGEYGMDVHPIAMLGALRAAGGASRRSSDRATGDEQRAADYERRPRASGMPNPLPTGTA
jgi:hypothetical protein